MSQKQYLSEERYQKVNKVFKIFYLVLSIIGLSMIIGGFVLLVKNNSIDYFNTEKIIAFILLALGISLTILSLGDLFRHAFARDITAYYAQRQIPLAQEGIEKMAPSVGTAAKEIAKGIKEGLKDE